MTKYSYLTDQQTLINTNKFSVMLNAKKLLLCPYYASSVVHQSKMLPVNVLVVGRFHFLKVNMLHLQRIFRERYEPLTDKQSYSPYLLCFSPFDLYL